MTFDTIRQDVLQAARLVRTQPILVLLICGLLSVGLGACALIFSVVDMVYLRSLPFAGADRLVWISGFDEPAGEPTPLAFPDYRDWSEANRAFQSTAAFSPTSLTVTGDDAPAEPVPAELVTAGYFEVFGQEPVAGRFFTADEEPLPVAVVGRGFWQRRFAEDMALLGAPLTLNGVSFTVVGIAPEGFRGLSGEAEVWIPVEQVGRIAPRLASLRLPERREVLWHFAVGRLADGASLDRAQAQLVAEARQLATEYPDSNEGRGLRAESLRHHLSGDVRSVLLALSGAGLFLLVVTWANAANLLVMLGLERRGATAIRLALGARSRRLVESALAESVLLGLVAGGGAWLVARGAGRIVEVLLAGRLPVLLHWQLGPRAFVFTFLLAVLTGVAVGSLPALAASRIGIVEELKSKATTGKPRRGARLLVVAESALAVVLALGAGLLGRSVDRFERIDLGFQPDRVVSARLTLPPGYTPREGAGLWQEVVVSTESVPGVEAASVAGDVLLSDGWTLGGVVAEGGGEAEDGPRSYRHLVAPGFFETLRVPLLAGRDFRWADAKEGADTVVVSAVLAHRLWPDGVQPLGRRLRLVEESGADAWRTVIGVVGEVKHHDLRSDARDPDLYVPFDPGTLTRGNLLVRAAGNPDAVLRTIPMAVQRAHRDIAVAEPETLSARLAEQSSDLRAAALVFRVFALVALLIAGSGIYGVLAHSVRRRKREIGLRMALGAETGSIVGLVLRESMGLVLTGAAVGWGLALASRKLIAGLLYGVSEADLRTHLFTVGILLALAICASLLPATIATRVRPATVLRGE